MFRYVKMTSILPISTLPTLDFDQPPKQMSLNAVAQVVFPAHYLLQAKTILLKEKSHRLYIFST